MVKKVTKIGNSQGLVFDSTLMQMTSLNLGDAIESTMKDDASTMQKLA